MAMRLVLIMTTTTENLELDTMFEPPHPGEILREDVFPEMDLTVTEAASQIGVSRVALSRVLNGRAAISPDMALRLEAWLGVENGGRAETWLTHQLVYDLWRARQKVACLNFQMLYPESARKSRLNGLGAIPSALADMCDSISLSANQ